MDIEALRLELERDEGVKYVTYNCSENRLTFGIGHLVLQSDPEYHQPIGTPVSADRVADCFNNDVETVIDDCLRLYPDFDSLPGEAQLIIANMMFNLGRPRLEKFRKMKKAIDERDFDEAANQMADSRWASDQVPNRANRLIERMRLLAIPV